MNKIPIYSIGYGSRTKEDFLEILIQNEIKFLVDIRTRPFSKFNPDFNQHLLKTFLQENNITYVFMGETLGGKPSDKSCYNSEGKVLYDVVSEKGFFKEGINRIKTAYRKNIKIILMCSESKPIDCHRSKLIGKVLAEDYITVVHIDENNKKKDQHTVISELNKGVSETDLFGTTLSLSSRKSYL